MGESSPHRSKICSSPSHSHLKKSLPPQPNFFPPPPPPPIKSQSPLPLNNNFQVILVLISYSLFTQVMLILVLIDVQHSQKAVFSFEKGSNCQNHSSSGSLHPVKKFHTVKFWIPPSPTPYHYLEKPEISKFIVSLNENYCTSTIHNTLNILKVSTNALNLYRVWIIAAILQLLNFLCKFCNYRNFSSKS